MTRQFLLQTALVYICAMAIMILICCCSHSMTPSQRRNFILVYATILVVIAAEVTTAFISPGQARLRWLKLITSYLGFLFPPAIPILFAGAMTNYRHSRKMLWFLGAYALLLLISLPLDLIYTIDAGNNYSRSRGYWIFLLVYGISIAHLVWVTLRLCRDYQNSNRVIMLLLLVFLVVGTVIQVLTHYAYLTWTCVCFVSVLFYVYCHEIWFQMDNLTTLLNHGIYLQCMENIPLGSTLILFDVDQFKYVNDNYGHLFGDQCLTRIAKAIRAVFGSSGQCFRVGGDEFAVLVRRKNFDARSRAARFRHFISQMRHVYPGTPDVSLGYAVYTPGKSIHDLINEADQNMYAEKHGKRLSPEV